MKEFPKIDIYYQHPDGYWVYRASTEQAKSLRDACLSMSYKFNYGRFVPISKYVYSDGNTLIKAKYADKNYRIAI